MDAYTSTLIWKIMLDVEAEIPWKPFKMMCGNNHKEDIPQSLYLDTTSKWYDQNRNAGEKVWGNRVDWAHNIISIILTSMTMWAYFNK